MSSDNPTLIPVPFHGDTITCVETPDGEFVAIRPICDRMNLNFSGQLQRLKADPDLWGVCVIHTPSAGGSQETNCIPRNRMAAWLFKIEVSRVKPEARDALRLYQREAADVLDRHFRQRDAQHETELRHLKGQLSRAQDMALASNGFWARLFFLHRAKVSVRDMAKHLRCSAARVMDEIETLEDAGILAPEGASGTDARSLTDLLRRKDVQIWAEKRKLERAVAEAKGQGDLFTER